MISGFRICDFCAPEYPIPSQRRVMEELEEILAGGLGGTNHFLVHGDGGTEEDEEGGSQKGEAQE